MHLYTVTNYEGHQVLTDEDWPTVYRFGARQQICHGRRWDSRIRGQQHDVRKDRELRVHSLENASRVLGRRMPAQNSTRGGRRHGGGQQLGANRGDFVNEEIRAGRELYQVLAEARVTGNHDGMAIVVHAIAESRLEQATVVDGKSGHFHPVPIKHDALANLVRDDRDASRWQSLLPAPHINV